MKNQADFAAEREKYRGKGKREQLAEGAEVRSKKEKEIEKGDG